jgi:hypothetical protein
MGRDICGAEPHVVSVLSDPKRWPCLAFTSNWKRCVAIYLWLLSAIEVGLVGVSWCGRPTSCGL